MIRDAVTGDAEAVAKLVTELGYPSSVDQVQHRLEAVFADPSYRTLVFEHEGSVAGMIGLRKGAWYEHDGHYVRIEALVVADAFRGRRVGEALVAAAEAWAHEEGCEALTVSSGKQRADAHRFYRRLGYEDTGLRFVKWLA